MGSGGSVGRVPVEGQRGTSRVSATRAGGSPVPRPVPLFSLKPVPSPHLVGLSRGAPQPVAGGRWEEDSQVRRDSECLSYNLMLNSGKKFRALRDKKSKYSNSCAVRKKNSERNGRSLRCLVRNKIKHRKKYKIGKSPTPLGKITIVLYLGKPRKENN